VTKVGETPDAARFHMGLQERTSVAACADLFREAAAQFGISVFACGEIDLADRDRAREIEAARLVALGRSDSEIAAELGISRSTAHKHVESGQTPEGEEPRAHGRALAMSQSPPQPEAREGHSGRTSAPPERLDRGAERGLGGGPSY
jgi:biotin operon repressor